MKRSLGVTALLVLCAGTCLRASESAQSGKPAPEAMRQATQVRLVTADGRPWRGATLHVGAWPLGEHPGFGKVDRVSATSNAQGVAILRLLRGRLYSGVATEALEGGFVRSSRMIEGLCAGARRTVWAGGVGAPATLRIPALAKLGSVVGFARGIGDSRERRRLDRRPNGDFVLPPWGIMHWDLEDARGHWVAGGIAKNSRIVGRDGRAEPVEMRQKRLMRVRVELRSDSGQPISGAKLRPARGPSCRSLYGVTDTEGVADIICGAEQARPGYGPLSFVRLFVEHPDYEMLSVQQYVELEEEGAALPRGKIDVTLAEGTRFRVRLLRARGVPWSGLEVQVTTTVSDPFTGMFCLGHRRLIADEQGYVEFRNRSETLPTRLVAFPRASELSELGAELGGGPLAPFLWLSQRVLPSSLEFDGARLRRMQLRASYPDGRAVPHPRVRIRGDAKLGVGPGDEAELGPMVGGRSGWVAVLHMRGPGSPVTASMQFGFTSVTARSEDENPGLIRLLTPSQRQLQIRVALPSAVAAKGAEVLVEHLGESQRERPIPHEYRQRIALVADERGLVQLSVPRGVKLHFAGTLERVVPEGIVRHEGVGADLVVPDGADARPLSAVLVLKERSLTPVHLASEAQRDKASEAGTGKEQA